MPPGDEVYVLKEPSIDDSRRLWAYPAAMSELRDQMWRELCDRFATNGFESLSPDERVWFVTRSLIDSIENGGLISYFYNSGADYYRECLEALLLLGATDVAWHFRSLAELFGQSVPITIDERNTKIDSWPDSGREDVLCEEVDEALMPLMPALEAMLAAHLPRTS